VRERTRAIAVLVAVFILGCLVGAAGSWLRYAKYGGAATRVAEGGPPPPRQERLPELLDMSSEQEARFEEIMAESRQRLDALRLEQRPKIDAVIEETNQKFHAILDEGQKAKLEAFLADLDRQRGREGRRGPGPRDGERDFGPPPPWRHQGPGQEPGRGPEAR